MAADSLVHNSDAFAAAQQLARGRPLISERWLADSIASSKLLDLKQYQLQAATSAATDEAHAGASPDAGLIKQLHLPPISKLCVLRQLADCYSATLDMNLRPWIPAMPAKSCA